jgi:nitrite reductase (NADH) small subunit
MSAQHKPRSGIVEDHATMTSVSPRDNAAWILVCKIDSIPVRGSRVVRTPHGQIALFRTSENTVFALDDRCPHAGGPLSQGIVHGNAVTCPLHNWIISLETGAALGADKGQVQTIPLRIEAGNISLRLDDLPKSSRCPRLTLERSSDPTCI